MNWEAVTAISTAGTGLVILLTVVFAAKQVQAMNEQSKAFAAQLEHLRLATQLDGTLAIFDELLSPELMVAYRFVMNEYGERMKDPRFHAEALEDAPDLDVHQERKMLRHMERVATLIKNELLDARVLLDYASDFIILNWEKLEPLVLEHRQVTGSAGLWRKFEFIAMKARLLKEAQEASALGRAEPS
jgi:hypothetical protein